MQLSRLVDGDLPEAERNALIDALLTDPELADRWKRYHTLGDLMRDGGVGADISQRVRAALEAGVVAADDVVVPLSTRLKTRAWLKPRGGMHARPALGLALAASVALATVVGLRVLVPEPGTPALATAGSAVPNAGPSAPMGEGVLPAGFGNPTALASRGQFGVAEGVVPVAGETSGAVAAQHTPGADLRLAEYLERHRREMQAGMLAGQEILQAVEPAR